MQTAIGARQKQIECLIVPQEMASWHNLRSTTSYEEHLSQKDISEYVDKFVAWGI